MVLFGVIDISRYVHFNLGNCGGSRSCSRRKICYLYRSLGTNAYGVSQLLQGVVMSGNLAEFLKVLLIVVSMSSIILSLRSFMNNLDTERDEEPDIKLDDVKQN